MGNSKSVPSTWRVIDGNLPPNIVAKVLLAKGPNSWGSQIAKQMSAAGFHVTIAVGSDPFLDLVQAEDADFAAYIVDESYENPPEGQAPGRELISTVRAIEGYSGMKFKPIILCLGSPTSALNLQLDKSTFLYLSGEVDITLAQVLSGALSHTADTKSL